MSESLGWGLDPYGISPYGGTQLGAGISVVSAVAISTHQVQVVLSGVPLHQSTVVVGDALNPATWMIQRLDSAAFFHVVQVQPVTTTTYNVRVFEKFGSVKVSHRISTATLKDVFSQTLIPPRSADFLGILAREDVSDITRAAAQNISATDIFNSQTPKSPAAVLQIGGNGDYVNVTGAELVRKLIFRRLMTVPGDFFHLPNYGAGVRIKEPVPSGDIIKLKMEIESQVLREPDVETVTASVSLAATGVLSIQVLAKLKKTGQSISLGLATQQTVSF